MPPPRYSQYGAQLKAQAVNQVPIPRARTKIEEKRESATARRQIPPKAMKTKDQKALGINHIVLFQTESQTPRSAGVQRDSRAQYVYIVNARLFDLPASVSLKLSHLSPASCLSTGQK